MVICLIAISETSTKSIKDIFIKQRITLRDDKSAGLGITSSHNILQTESPLFIWNSQ